MVEGSGAPNNLLARASVGTAEAERGQQAGIGLTIQTLQPRPGIPVSPLTLLESGWPGRDLLVGIHRGLRG